MDPARRRRPRGDVVNQYRDAARPDEASQLLQGSVQVLHVMQGRRAEDQVEPPGIAERHQVGHDIAHVRSRVMPRDGDQRLADVDANDFVKSPRECPRMAPRSTAGIQSPASMRGQLGEQPAQHALGFQTGETVIVGGEAIE